MRRFPAASLAIGVAAATLLVGGAVSAQVDDPSKLKIGLVTDVGSLNDKNFNEYSWEGTKDGAARVGAPEPAYAVSKASADIAKNIQGFVDQDYDVIVTVGYAAGLDTIKAAKANPDIRFIGVDQDFQCVDENGDPDTTPADDPNTPTKETPDCNGVLAEVLPNFVGIGWREQQPGYLAGVVAAHLTKSGTIAAIGGTASVPAVPNYIVGYKNGAESVNPDINVIAYYISPAPDGNAFNNQPLGNLTTEQLLGFFPDIDVFFQVAGATGNGVLEAACENGLWAIGVDVDQFESVPDFQECTVVSAEKKLKKNVSDMISKYVDGTIPSGGVKLDITSDDVGLSSFHTHEDLVTPEMQADLDAATAGLKDGTIVACEPNPFGACVRPEGF